ncbi:MAG TPA: bifunctional alpha,alpha-trehalose-phosphate synthase (UDP-forming)/trehalose-phosphatase [Chthoniobacterales bacterium]
MPRLIVVSNRLSFSLKHSENGYKFTPSCGGLATALSGYIQRQREEDPHFDCIWVGWPGGAVASEDEARLKTQALRDHRAYPVFLSAEDMERFYNGFCNATLWPLFHYFPNYARYEEDHWQTYVRVNRLFCEAVSGIAEPGDVFWIHDYHLLLLPRMLRERLQDASIGFFLHIPFPSFEVFRQLPTRWRRQILEGMLGADLIGFHTQDYTQYFLHSVFRTLGHEHHLGQITMAGEVRRAEAFPIGIDFDKFMTAANSKQVAADRAEIEQGLRWRRVILSVDRLDYSKGILHRLRGYEALLESSPEWRGRVAFILAVVPSRVEVERYQRMKHDLDELVGQINGAYGTVDWVPIIYQYRQLGFTELVTLYNLAPVALITPLRDGMNLVAKEYLASKPDGTGVLILSEMAGVARELGEALQINPNHRGEIAEALKEALCMSVDEQVRRNRPMQERLKAYDDKRWVSNFLSALDRIKARQGKLATGHLSRALRQEALAQYRAANKRFILLDYDGTLVPFASQPHLAAPDASLLELMRALCAEPRNEVFIISGRDRPLLEDWFKGIPVRIIAEHGAWIRSPEGKWRLLKPLASEWKRRLRPLLQAYVDRVPGSLLEEKDYSLAWHYRRADPEHGEQRAKELIDDIVSFTANFDVQVVEGKKVVEVRNAGVNKGAAALQCLEAANPDFIVALGDDQTDEDLFKALPGKAVSVRVGSPHSHAKYHVVDYVEARDLLESLCEHRD